MFRKPVKIRKKITGVDRPYSFAGLNKLFIVALTLLMVEANAQTAHTLDSVNVTASLHQTEISTTRRDIVVIRGETFQNAPVHSLDKLLRYVPGIEVQQRGPQGSQSDLLIRGGTFQQVLVLIDGIRLNDPLTGHFSSYIPLTPAEIDRIEVMKGAASAIYGSDAVGGVIHIITKAFASTHPGNHLGAQLTAGEYGLLNVNNGVIFIRINSRFPQACLQTTPVDNSSAGSTGVFLISRHPVRIPMPGRWLSGVLQFNQY